SAGRSASASAARAPSDGGASGAGLTVGCRSSGWGSTHSPLMNKPYDGWISTMSRDSGAGAYSNMASVQGEVVGACVPAGGQLLALHQQIVQERRGAQPEPLGVEPVGAGEIGRASCRERVEGSAAAA